MRKMMIGLLGLGFLTLAVPAMAEENKGADCDKVENDKRDNKDAPSSQHSYEYEKSQDPKKPGK